MLQARESAQQTVQGSVASVADWRVQAEPITKQALLAVQTAADSQQADIALALEMEAEALGQTPEAKRLWEQSTEIRKRLVASLMSGHDGPQEHPYCDAFRKPIASPQNPLAGPEASALYEAVASYAFVVDKDGRPINIRLLRAVSFGHDEEGAKAVTCWRFKPGMRNGHPVPVPASVEINYRVFWAPVVESKPREKRQHSETVTPQLSR
jgi:outer membrane biosynthesis protein TonB